VDPASIRQCIIATGSRPVVLPGLDVESPLLMNSTSALDLVDVPARLLVVAAGYIGLELARCTRARLGRDGGRGDGTVCCPCPIAHPRRVLAKRLETRLAGVLLGPKSRSSSSTESLPGAPRRCTERPDATFDRVLAGRRPRAERDASLVSKNTGVKVDERGFIVVDAARRRPSPASSPSGDVGGEPCSRTRRRTRAGPRLGRSRGAAVAFDPQRFRRRVHRSEIAWCGLTRGAGEAGGRGGAGRPFPWAPRAARSFSGAATGSQKCSSIRKPIGCWVPASWGTARAILIRGDRPCDRDGRGGRGSSAHDPSHPTLSETLMEAAEVALGESVHIYVPARHRERPG